MSFDRVAVEPLRSHESHLAKTLDKQGDLRVHAGKLAVLHLLTLVLQLCHNNVGFELFIKTTSRCKNICSIHYICVCVSLCVYIKIFFIITRISI